MSFFGSSSDSFVFGSTFSGSSAFALLATGTGFFVFREKLKPDFGWEGLAAAGFVGGGIFLSSFGPSSSTRKSFEGRKGLSSASTDGASAAG